MSDLSDAEMKKMRESIAAKRAARLAKETNGLAPTGDAGPVKADGNNGLAPTGGAGPAPHGKETQRPVGLWPASCNALMMIIRICMAFMSEAWSKGYIVPVLCFIGTVMRCPFVSMVWSGVYLAASVACLVLTWSQAARTAVLVFGGATWEKTKQAAVYAYEAGFVWVLPLAFLVGTVACYYLTGWWSLTIIGLINTFVCSMCCYSKDIRDTLWEKVNKTQTYAFFASLQDNTWDTIESAFKFCLKFVRPDIAEACIVFMALATIVVLFVVFAVRIASNSQVVAQMVIVFAFGLLAPKAMERGVLAYIAMCCIAFFCVLHVPGNQSSLTTPHLNNLRADDLMRLLWNAGLALWTPYMRIDQMTRCDGKWESDWCKQLIAVVKTENKIYREIGDKHVKNEDLFSRYHTVDFVLNATKNYTENVSIGDVIGKNFHLFDTTSYKSNILILENNAVDYLLIDAYNRTEQAAHDTKEERDTNFAVDNLWTAVSSVTNHAVKMAVLSEFTGFLKEFTFASYVSDFGFLSYKLAANPGNHDDLFYDHSLARNVCTHMHLCVNGTPMVEKETTTVKNLTCSVNCSLCPCNQIKKVDKAKDTTNASDAPKADNATNAKNNTNETAEEPPQTVLEGIFVSQFTDTAEKETMAKPDATADATDDARFTVKAIHFKYATVFSVILFVFVGMAMETYRAWMEMIVPTPAPSRIVSRPGSKSTSGTTTPNGTARNSGPKVDLSAGVWARLAAVAE